MPSNLYYFRAIYLIFVLSGFLPNAFLAATSNNNFKNHLELLNNCSLNYLLFDSTRYYDSYKIQVFSGGMTRIQYNELPNFSGFIVGKKMVNLALHFNQQEVPILVNENGGYFDFFVDPVLFEEHGYPLSYWLRINSTLGLRIKEGEPLQLGNGLVPIEYVKQIRRYEENKRYETTMPNRYYPHWIWKLVRKQEAFTFDLKQKLDQKKQTTLRVLLYGAKNDRHLVNFYLNDHFIGKSEWYGQMDFLFEQTFPTKVLFTGRNKLRIETARSTRPEAVYLDWFEIEAEMMLELSNKQVVVSPGIEGKFNLEINTKEQSILVYHVESPEKISFYKLTKNGTSPLQLPVSLANESKLIITKEHLFHRDVAISNATRKSFHWPEPVQYIMITHKEFLNEILRLAKYYDDSGMKTRVVLIDEIYDRYTDGLPKPSAIREFLDDAFYHYGLNETLHVLLVGDASYDPQNYLGGKLKNYIPTHLFQSRNKNMQTATDDWYITSREGELLPIALGRLPVQTGQELRAVIKKIIDYQESAGFSNTVLFVIDTPRKKDNFSFDEVSERVIAQIDKSRFKVIKANYNKQEQPNMDSMINGILNKGILVWNYIGHGAMRRLSNKHSKMYEIDDVAHLNNDKLPFVVFSTCLAGVFHHFEQQSLAEALLLKEKGGAIGVFAATGFSNLYSSGKLLGHFFSLLSENGNLTIGELIVRAKRLGIELGEFDLQETNLFVLLGDPAVRLKVVNNNQLN